MTQLPQQMGLTDPPLEFIQSLPSWATVQVDEDQLKKVFIDPSIAYPLYLSALGLEADRYGVDIAMRCLTRDLSMLPGYNGIWFKILNRPAWALTNLPIGFGSDAAIKNFMSEYNRLLELRKQKGSTTLPV